MLYAPHQYMKQTQEKHCCIASTHTGGGIQSTKCSAEYKEVHWWGVWSGCSPPLLRLCRRHPLIPALLRYSSSKEHSACPSLPALLPLVLKMLSFEFPDSFQCIVTLFCSEDLYTLFYLEHNTGTRACLVQQHPPVRPHHSPQASSQVRNRSAEASCAGNTRNLQCREVSGSEIIKKIELSHLHSFFHITSDGFHSGMWHDAHLLFEPYGSHCEGMDGSELLLCDSEPVCLQKFWLMTESR